MFFLDGILVVSMQKTIKNNVSLKCNFLRLEHQRMKTSDGMMDVVAILLSIIN